MLVLLKRFIDIGFVGIINVVIVSIVVVFYIFGNVRELL